MISGIEQRHLHVLKVEFQGRGAKTGKSRCISRYKIWFSKTAALFVNGKPVEKSHSHVLERGSTWGSASF